MNQFSFLVELDSPWILNYNFPFLFFLFLCLCFPAGALRWRYTTGTEMEGEESLPITVIDILCWRMSRLYGAKPGEELELQ